MSICSSLSEIFLLISGLSLNPFFSSNAALSTLKFKKNSMVLFLNIIDLTSPELKFKVASKFQE